MNRLLVVALAVIAPALAFAVAAGPASHAQGANAAIVSQAALLEGLAAGALFPFIDSTPNLIRRAHVAITDETVSCAPGAAPPNNIQVLVGQAGGTLVQVMTAATNTGIGTPAQCVFHVTVQAGAGGIPATVTDIVVVNAGALPLDGANTVTASAEIQSHGAARVH